MAILDRRAAWLLLGILAVVALIGFAHGLQTALEAPKPEQVAAGVDPRRDPVPNAAALAGPALDEARVRAIAREEVGLALGARKKAAAAPKPVDEADDPQDAAAPMAVPPPPSAAPAAPAPAAQPPG